MSSNRSAAQLRAEDLLTLSAIGGLLLFARGRAALMHARIDDMAWWELSFVVFPATLLVFILALRYAFGNLLTLNTTLRRAATVIRDWMPFALFIVIYETFRSKIWLVILPHDRDSELLAIDRWMLHETPAVTMQSWISAPLTNLMAIAYFLHLVLPPVLALSLYFRGLIFFRRFLLAIFVGGIIGFIGYIAVPAVGPAVAFPQLFHTSLGSEFADPVLGVIDAARAPRDCFPSLHVALSTIVLWYGARNGRRWFWALLPLVLANWVSTMYLRYHYAVDILAGWACAALAIAIGALLLRVEASFQRDE
jgi:membrane-associated phospholipid phosphatase